MEGATPPPQPVDPELAGFEDLMGYGIPGPIDAAFDHYGSTVDTVRRVQVTWRPSRHLMVRYRVEATGGELAGTHQVIGTVGRIPDGVLRIDGPDSSVGVWVLPSDPVLHGLASALDVATVQALLPSLGIDERVDAVRLRAYRPMRRAVVEVRTATRSVYLKVVPAAEITRLHDIHRHLAPHLPVPDSLGFASELGIMVLAAVPGSTLREVLLAGAGDLPDPRDIGALIGALREPARKAKRMSALQRVPTVIELLEAILPHEADRLAELAASIGPEHHDDLAPVHGDFHEAQIMILDGHPTGLLDVDTYGWGRAADDPATMLAHLTALTPRSRNPDRARTYALGMQRMWDAEHEPADLRRRTAAVLLGLATGPFRVQTPNWPEETSDRISIAAAWAESARTVQPEHGSG